MVRNLPSTIACAVLAAASALAQPPARPGDGPAPNPPPPGVGPFGPGFGPTNLLSSVKGQIGATDEEWKVIGPKLQKVMAARQVLAADVRGPDLAPGFGPGAPFPGGFGRPGGFPGPGGFGPFAAPPGGFPGLPQPGQILAPFLQDVLKLTADQKKQLAELQKEVDDRVQKLLTDDQKKQFAQMQKGFGPGGPPGAPPSAPPAGPEEPPKSGAPAPASAKPAAPGGVIGPPMANSVIGQARADLKTVLDDPKHSSAAVQEKIEAVRQARCSVEIL